MTDKFDKTLSEWRLGTEKRTVTISVVTDDDLKEMMDEKGLNRSWALDRELVRSRVWKENEVEFKMRTDRIKEDTRWLEEFWEKMGGK
jgi:hypothetical protein